jgi:hypothetical protein
VPSGEAIVAGGTRVEVLIDALSPPHAAISSAAKTTMSRLSMNFPTSFRHWL